MHPAGLAVSEAAALLAAFADVAVREAAAARLATWVGAEELLVFLLDPDVSALLPPPGFRATVRGGASFRAFLKDAARPGAHQAQVEYPPSVTQTVLARVTQEGLAFVLVAGTPIQERLAAVVAGSPLLAALLHAENRKRVAEGEAAVARAAGRRANDLANALDSARLELEHALGESARLNRELQENDRRKDEFLAMLGHELRNPLAAIRGALEVMRFSKDAEHVHQAHAVVDRQSAQLTRLVDDLLDVSRVSQGKIVLRPAPVALSDVVRNAVETTRNLVESRQHQLEVDADSTAYAMADPARLEQMVTNLLTNAAKYTEPGGRIRVSFRREKQLVVLRVEDDGIGIAPEMLSQVFDPFVQVTPSIDGGVGGLGIGLTLVKRLAALHGGDITVTSERGKGSTFALQLPAIDPPVPSSADTEPARTSSEHHKQILIVDDNIDSGEMMAALLEAWGHHPLHVADGPAALEAVAQRVPDVVLLDIGLPGMDGYEVAARIRASYDPRQVHIIALSGYGQEEDRRKSRAAGCDDHLVKPVDIAKLESLLDG